ncbi:DUF1906 domain-containing protein [Pseudonocardiaceae bacterium YIM PH 21723]|nr:DUF1906 domain-containing protein [Pseudonocardiaceae bacterium YIM PH 21723]
MDDKVLKAQQWVNGHYGNVQGYQRCPEDGHTGWLVMYSLITALQHELGITTLTTEFGPTTMAKVQALGTISRGWSANKNIVTILQHALWCKGYSGSDADGDFDGTTEDSVKEIRGHMGISPDGDVPAKVFKAIMNMDAYVVPVNSGGTDKVREIQQWLNGKFWTKANFDIGPADGHYSRDVQKSLMKAIQYQLSDTIPENEVNGEFGQRTRAGLQAHTLQWDAQGIWVELFSAACVFNEPIGEFRTSKRDRFDSKLAEFVAEFQKFSELVPVTAIGDYATWCQLLVSTGDPDRPVKGCDTRFEITESRAAWLKANGFEIVGRYIYDPPDSTLDKEIKPGELQRIFNAGLRVFPIYQDNARRIEDFSFANGRAHAVNAHKLAIGYGFDRGTTIYFAVDYDATQDQIDSAIVPYFQGVAAGLAANGKHYVHGVYGSRNVCTGVTKNTYARYSFVSGMSTGFSGNLGFPMPANWSFNQVKELNNIGDGFDLDRDAVRSGGDPGAGAVNTPANPADGFIDYLGWVYRIADRWRGEHPGDRNPSQLVMEYLRSFKYNNDRFDILIGAPDHDWLNYAAGYRDERGPLYILGSFRDPVTGHEISVDHLMASINGHYVTPPSTDGSNGGDVGGWAGDLMTFYVDWRKEKDHYPDGGTYCAEKLARIGVESRFGFGDLLEDTDAWHLAAVVRGGRNIVDAVTDYYLGTDCAHRFTNFVNQRFSGKEDVAAFMAHEILVSSTNPMVMAGRFGLIRVDGSDVEMPNELDRDVLKTLEDGFAKTLFARAKAEG